MSQTATAAVEESVAEMTNGELRTQVLRQREEILRLQNTVARQKRVIDVAESMRVAQRMYFSTRDQAYLNQAKMRERELDKLLDGLKQQDLFSANPAASH